jgi:hypothetical protein
MIVKLFALGFLILLIVAGAAIAGAAALEWVGQKMLDSEAQFDEDCAD